VLLVCDKKDPDVMVGALRSGVREFLFEPLVPADVAATVKRLATTATGGVAKTGFVEAFLPCKAGSGTTFIAANLAHILASSLRRKVLLLDLNLQFGDAYLFVMDQVPGVTIADVCGGIARLDVAFLESATTKLESGLHLLAAPATPEEGDAVRPEQVASIIGLARSLYDFVIVDLGNNLDAVALKALDMADHINAVLQLDLPYIRHATRLKSVFAELGYSAGKVRWVVNRYMGKEDITLSDAERLVAEAFWTVPNDRRVALASVNQGIPVFRFAPRSALAKSLVDWANHLVPGHVEPKGWFRLLRRSAEEGTS
jgi:pilus assembly protein CpaE